VNLFFSLLLNGIFSTTGTIKTAVPSRSAPYVRIWNFDFRLNEVIPRIGIIMAVGLLMTGSTALVVEADSSPSSRAAQRNYVRRAQAQIDHLTAGLRRTEQKLDHLDPAARSECEETLRRLWRKERLARVNLEAIRRAPMDRWQILHRQEDALLIRLQKSYQHLVNRYFRSSGRELAGRKTALK
jgi:hypothetical protein